MSRIIAVTNQKGGVGKTTTSVNLCAALAASDRRVLLIDIDPQGNATMGCGVDKHELERSTYDVLIGEARALDAIIHVEASGFDLMPSNGDVTAAEVALLNGENGQRALRDALTPIESRYDYVIIDCPPALNMLTINALVSAQSVLIPMQCEYYALEGLSALLDTIDQIASTVNPELKVEGLLRTMFDPRNNLSNEVSAQLILHFGDKVYRTVVPRNVRLAEAPSHGLPVLQYDRLSRGAKAYQILADEVLRREHPRQVA
ncbi:MAG: ParA family protein [Gammaproteobacteria bacterium]|nr:ParA family protein [Gammaproteobacteria bacterium]